MCGRYAAPHIVLTAHNHVHTSQAGVILYIMLKGEFPWEEASKRCEVFQNLVGNTFQWDPIFGPATTLLQRMLCIDPAQRATLSEVTNALRCKHASMT